MNINDPCVVCGKPITVVDFFAPTVDGVRHSRCDDTYCPVCGEHRRDHDYACEGGFRGN